MRSTYHFHKKRKMFKTMVKANLRVRVRAMAKVPSDPKEAPGIFTKNPIEEDGYDYG